MKRCALVAGILLLVIAAGATAEESDLFEYVNAPDPSFAWEVKAETDLAGGKACSIDLTSQTWRGIVWKHWVTLVVPDETAFPDAVVLVVNGGKNGRPAPKLASETGLFAMGVAAKMGCAVAILDQVPNQPLLENRSEDGLIAHTFDQYIETGEKDWPLLLPMTKSAVRAMDAIQAVLLEKYDRKIERFCVTGGSKRGWTTWLAAAVDRRVAAIAPMVIDMLHFKVQGPHQLFTWGRFSEEIHDYTELDLPRRMEATPRGEELLRMVDPWHHRHRITIPKLLLFGTNDRYWPVDAATNYFQDLVGETYAHYVPNAGHGLDASVADTLTTFFRRVLAGRPLPRLAWRTVENGSEVYLTVLPGEEPRGVALWTAASDSRDFRDSAWTSRPLEKNEFGAYVAKIPRPEEAKAHVAFFARVDFSDEDGRVLPVTTVVEIAGAMQ
ncbi:MAG: phenylacetic acid degradation protein [Planctomycetes bacterium]|nr:phenylacetic acid degradation protein [Planctomycetota bacterium]